MKLGEKIRRARAFLRGGLWEAETEGLSRAQRALLRGAQLVAVVLREFVADQCLLRASALTYATLLSIVPLFALTFSVLTGLGVQNTLQPILLEKITGGGEEIVNAIVGYINNTNFGRLGVAGLLGLVFTVIALLSNIEASLNSLWGVRESRPLFRRFSDYTSVLLLAPLFLFAAISMTSTLESQAFVQALMDMAFVGQVIFFLFRVLPYLAMWAAFTFLYLFMPNVKVQFRAAVIGGIFGGTLWQLAQWGYVSFQVGVSKYNAIYGTLAAIPILMIWIYISWLIVLLGAEVTYAVQNLHAIRREIREQKINMASQEMVALAVLMKVTEVFYRGERPWTLERIAEALCLPPRLARTITAELTALGYLSEVRDEEEGDRYQPGRPPERTFVHGVIQDFRRSGVDLQREGIPQWSAVRKLEERLAAAEGEVLEGLTLRDLALEGKRA